MDLADVAGGADEEHTLAEPAVHASPLDDASGCEATEQEQRDADGEEEDEQAAGQGDFTRKAPTPTRAALHKEALTTSLNLSLIHI